MNLNHLAIFHATAEEQSVSRAADRLLVSQPAVSKQLRQLERQLGTTLFERIPKGVRPTPTGRVLADYARRIFALVDEAQQAVADVHSLRTGRLRVGVTPTVSAYILPKILVRLRQRFPGLDVAVEVEHAAILRERLESRVLDFALAESNLASPTVDAKPFLHEPLVVVARPDHPLARRRSVSRSDLRDQTLIVRDAGADHEPLARRALGLAATLTLLPLGTSEAVKEAAAEGLGIAVLPRLTVRADVAARRLAILRMRDPLPTRTFYHVRLAGRHTTKAETAFACLLKHAARGPLPPLGGRRTDKQRSR